MCQHLARRCKAVLTIGDLGLALAQMLESAPERRAEIRGCGRLEHAVEFARRIASRGDVILLSTGCASYDQFVNFEARGEAFTRLVTSSR